MAGKISSRILSYAAVGLRKGDAQGAELSFQIIIPPPQVFYPINRADSRRLEGGNHQRRSAPEICPRHGGRAQRRHAPHQRRGALRLDLRAKAPELG